MVTTVTVRKVENKADHQVFFRFPWKIYKDDPNWVPPLLSIRRDTLNPEKNPSWDYLEGDYFIAWQGEEPVGTIAAFVNNWHNEFHNEHVAWFGFFESIHDKAVGQALLETAVQWSVEHGYDAVRGPQSFTTHEECGLLIDGFERPVMLMPYNPPYYQELLEDAGFHKAMDTFSFYYNWDMLKENNAVNRIERLIKRVNRNTNFSVRPINRKNLKADFAIFKEIYNDSWDNNWGFTPMTEKELDNLVESLGMFFDPHLACFVEDDGKPVGFMLGVPDFNQVLYHAQARPGIPEPITLLRALWHWKIRTKIDTFRIPLMGVRPEYRKKGLDLLMYDYFLRELPKLSIQYKHMDSGWILESNQDMMGILQSVGLDPYRHYRFYEKATQ